MAKTFQVNPSINMHSIDKMMNISKSIALRIVGIAKVIEYKYLFISMNKITKVSCKSLKSKEYLIPLTVRYVENHTEKQYDCVVSKGGVIIIIYNTTREVLVLVKQFRPSAYIGNIPLNKLKGNIDTKKYPPELGFTLEFCGGTRDKNLPVRRIAAEEVFEECGYKVDPDSLEFVLRYVSGDGGCASARKMYYCEVTDDMRVSQGGGIDDEDIEVVEMSVLEIRQFLNQTKTSPPCLIAGLYWFLDNKVRDQIL